MKLLMVVIHHRDARRLRDQFIEADLRFTELGSTGGFLREGSVTFMLGVDGEQVEQVVGMVRQTCPPREEVAMVATPGAQLYHNPVGEGLTVTIGGAQIFQLAMERMISV